MSRDRKPEWAYWQQQVEWALWEAAALAENIEPRTVGRDYRDCRYNPEKAPTLSLRSRLESLDRAVETNRPESYGLILTAQHAAALTSTITPADFLRWCDLPRNRWEVPEEMRTLADRVTEPEPSSPPDELPPRSRALMLKIIRVLAVKAEVPEKKAGEAVQAWAADLDIELKADTVTRVLKEAQQEFG